MMPKSEMDYNMDKAETVGNSGFLLFRTKFQKFSVVKNFPARRTKKRCSCAYSVKTGLELL